MCYTGVEITGLLQDWGDGKKEALDELLPLVFDDLRRMASRCLQREDFYTLESNALVNEVFIRLLKRRRLEWQNRAQFFGFIGKEMRRILVDYARRKKAVRRGGGQRPLCLDEAIDVARSWDIDLEALDQALDDLARLDPDLSQIVELKFFVGLHSVEIAKVLQISESTLRRRWRSARTWLFRELKRDQSSVARGRVRLNGKYGTSLASTEQGRLR